MASSRRLLLTSLLLASGLGCATARNYEDPAVPVYKGGVADRRDAGATLRVVTFNLKWGKEIDRAVECCRGRGPSGTPTSWCSRRWTGRAPSGSAAPSAWRTSTCRRPCTPCRTTTSEWRCSRRGRSKRRASCCFRIRTGCASCAARPPSRRCARRSARCASMASISSPAGAWEACGATRRARSPMPRAGAGPCWWRRQPRQLGDGQARLLLGDRGGGTRQPLRVYHVVARALRRGRARVSRPTPATQRHKPVWPSSPTAAI